MATGSTGGIEQANEPATPGRSSLHHVAGGHISSAFDKFAVIGAHAHTTVHASTDGWSLDAALRTFVAVQGFSSRWGYIRLYSTTARLANPLAYIDEFALDDRTPHISHTKQAESLARDPHITGWEG